MKKPERQLEALLKSIEGIDYTCHYDHESRQWVQTGLTLKRGRNSTEVGILNHLYWEGLTAKLHRIPIVKAKFPSEERQFVRNSYNALVEGLKNLGYKIQELPADESISEHIMTW